MDESNEVMWAGADDDSEYLILNIDAEVELDKTEFAMLKDAVKAISEKRGFECYFNTVNREMLIGNFYKDNG